MVLTVSIPNWYFGNDVIFEFLFAIVTLIISLLSYRVYNVSHQKNSLLFSSAFGAISLSYFLKSILNIAIYNKVTYGGGEIYKTIQDIISLRDIGEFLQLIFMLFGLLIMIWIFVKNKDPSLFTLTALLTFIIAGLTKRRSNLGYIVIALFLIFITVRYLKNYKDLPSRNRLMVFLGFSLLTVGNLLYIFSPIHHYFYLGGHIAELVGYISLAINLLCVFRMPKQ